MKKLGEIYLLFFGYELKRQVYFSAEENKKLCRIDNVWCELTIALQHLKNNIAAEYVTPIKNSKYLYPNSGVPNEKDVENLARRLKENAYNIDMFAKFLMNTGFILTDAGKKDLESVKSNIKEYNFRVRALYNSHVKSDKVGKKAFEEFKNKN